MHCACRSSRALIRSAVRSLRVGSQKSFRTLLFDSFVTARSLQFVFYAKVNILAVDGSSAQSEMDKY